MPEDTQNIHSFGAIATSPVVVALGHRTLPANVVTSTYTISGSSTYVRNKWEYVKLCNICMCTVPLHIPIVHAWRLCFNQSVLVVDVLNGGLYKMERYMYVPLHFMYMYVHM